MPYCTQTDLLKAVSEADLAELTAESGDTPDADVIAQAIAQAGAEIDGYLAVRYTLPLAETPERVKYLAVDISLFHLYTRRGMMPEVRRTKYEDALGFLRDVRDGRGEIVGAAGVEMAGDVQGVQDITSATRVFDRDKLSGW